MCVNAFIHCCSTHLRSAYTVLGTSLIAQMVKNLPTMWETQVQSLGRENPLQKEMATHSRTLAWKIPWTVAYQAPPSMRFSRQEYWSGVPFPSPGDLPDPGIEPGSPTL